MRTAADTSGMRRWILPLALLATGTILAASPAWGARPTTRSRPGRAGPAADGTHVEVHDQYFSPTTVPVSRGGTVVFDFVGEGHHTATDDSGLDLYDSGLVDGGGPSLSVDFPAAGAYRFTCTPHPFMGGRVEVPARVSPRNGDLGDRFTVTWARPRLRRASCRTCRSAGPAEPGGSGATAVTGTSRVFRPDAGAGVYRFRARLRDGGRQRRALVARRDRVRSPADHADGAGASARSGVTPRACRGSRRRVVEERGPVGGVAAPLPWMNSSTISRAASSLNCTGGDFMKYALGPISGPADPAVERRASRTGPRRSRCRPSSGCPRPRASAR